MPKSKLTIDHIVHYVENLDIAVEDFQKNGFNVLRGGIHTGGITQNAMIHFLDGTFIELIKKSKSSFKNLFFVLVGDEGDRISLEEKLTIEGMTLNLINLLGRTNFDELCTVLDASKSVIAHDSGVMHIADALNKPLIALYGPTDYKRTSPLSKKSIVLHSKNECWAKMYAFRESESSLAIRFPSGYCMSAITIDVVEEKLAEILN